MPIPDQTALVKKIKDELIAKGQTFTTNCDAFQITGRVAWALRDQSAMLIVKTPGQNGCTWTNGVRYSHDAIAFSDGWVDCLGSAGPPLNTNQPSWQWHSNLITAPLAAPFTLEAPPVNEAHKYIGGDNDTGICDQCGRPRTDPVHEIHPPTVRHAYDGGGQDTGLCDICHMPKDDPIHTVLDGSSDALARTVAALEAKVQALEAASVPSHAMVQRVAALEAKVHALEAASIQYGLSIALRTDNGHVICAEGGGGNEVNATRKTIGKWETFLVEKPR